MLESSRRVLGLSAALLCATLSVAVAQDKVPVGAFTFPTSTNTTLDLIKAKGFDAANGIDVVPVPYGSPGAEYAGMAKGEIVAGVLSPYQLVKMQAEGVPCALYATLIGLATIQVITRTPEVKSFADLKGRSLAATVGFSEYQYMEIYGRKIGLELRKDTNLVDASTALAQTQLQAGRVDAAVLWEPAATQALKTMPDARVILRGDEAWQTVTGTKGGWDVVLFVNPDWVKTHRSVLPRMVKMYQDYASYLMSAPDEADAIITSGKYTSKGLPPGIIADAVRGKRLVADVHAAWEPDANKQIWQLLQTGVDYKEIDALPGRDAVVNENPAK